MKENVFYMIQWGEPRGPPRTGVKCLPSYRVNSNRLSRLV